jgi:membrane associated rhomboid family serine protease
VASRFQFALPDPRPRDGWFRVGKLDITTTALLVFGGIASMFLYAVNTGWLGQLVFHPIAVRDGDLWRIVTWPIANPPTRLLVVLTLVFFWLVGHIVEEMLGRTRFTVLIAIITIIPAVIVTALPPESFPTLTEVGLSLLLTTLFVVYAAENPNAPSFFGIPIWILAAVFIGIDVLRVVGDRLWGTLIMMLLSMACALVVVRQWGFVARLSFIPKLAGGQKPHPPRRGPAPPRATSRKSDRRRSGQVVEGPWSSPAPPQSTADAAAAQVELDSLLDKISATGLDSLTTDEKRRLNELSKRLR